jgi:hypothetical protein
VLFWAGLKRFESCVASSLTGVEPELTPDMIAMKADGGLLFGCPGSHGSQSCVDPALTVFVCANVFVNLPEPWQVA